jgi:DNA polymerase-4
VDALWGVGPVTAAKLRERGITKLVDVRTADAAQLQQAVGSLSDWLTQLAHGVDNRPVVPNRETKSSGTEITYDEDLLNRDEIRHEVEEMALQAGRWLVRREVFARTVTLKVRYDDFTTVTRSHTEPPTQDARGIAARAVQLLDRTDAGRRPVRLLGVSVHNIVREPTPAARDDDARLPFDAPDEASGGTEDATNAAGNARRNPETNSAG